MTSVKDTIKELKGTDADFADLIEQEKAGKNRKSLIKWLEEQLPESLQAAEVATEETLVGQVDTIEGGELPINDLITILSQKRDRWQRSRGCGLENIRVHLGEIQVTVR